MFTEYNNSAQYLGDTHMKKLSVLVVLLLLVVSVGAYADDLKISDLTEGTPTIQVISGGVDVTASRVTIMADSGPEYLHFLIDDANIGSGQMVYTQLFEFVGGQVSDQLALFLNPNSNLAEVWFASDPVYLGFLQDPVWQNIGNSVETGGYQLQFTVYNTHLGDGTYNYYVQSDSEIPEPASLVLMGSGLMGLASRLRKKLV